MKIFNIIFFTFINQSFQLKIEFKKEKYDNINHENLLNNKYFINLKIGNPPQIIKCYLNMETHIFFISENKNFGGTYNKILSKTYKKKLSDIVEFTIGKYTNKIFGYESEDNFLINEKKKINLSFILTKNISNKIEFNSSIIGFKIKPYPNIQSLNFISQLYKNNLINNEIFYFKYTTNFEGELVMGNYPHESNSLYDKKNLKLINTQIPIRNLDYEIIFDKISYFNIKSDTSLMAKFSFDFNGIIGSRYSLYKLNESFFEPFFKNKICEIKILNNLKLYGYICNNNLPIEKFKSIYFYSKKFNYTFELNYKDLFLLDNEKYYFLLYFNINLGDTRWHLGHVFLQKYLIIFNQAEALLGFYSIMNNNDNNNKKKIITISYLSNILIIIINFIIVLIIYYLLKKKQRKKRKNEIELDYNNIFS